MRFPLPGLVLSVFLLSQLVPCALPARAGPEPGLEAGPRLASGGDLAARPTWRDLWVDPVAGKDSRSGRSRAEALRTLRAAWDRVPAKTPLKGTGVRILLVAGSYGMDSLPAEGWMESRHGTAGAPLVIESADGPGKARIRGHFNLFDCRYLTLSGLRVAADPGVRGGNTIHIEKGDHVTLARCSISGFDGQENLAQEALKVNQSRFIDVDECDISGGTWFALDFVAVHSGRIRKSGVHDSGDDGMVLKGGSSSLVVEGNRVYDCGNVGMAAGQGTGFEFMEPPWLHYEVYDLRLVNNVVCRTQNAGVAVRGGYNVLVAHNTFYKTSLDGERGGPLLLLSPGARSCDGDSAACRKRQAMGGWGPVTPGSAGECIPNRNVFVFNNVFYNPRNCATRWSHFTVFGPAVAPRGTNIPGPVLSDDNLRMGGNVIWNGPPSHPLGIGEEGQGCQAGHPTCNEAILRRDNMVNTREPTLVAPDKGDFRLKDPGAFVAVSVPTLPDFPGNDRPARPPVPPGDLANRVVLDFHGARRSPRPVPGALP